MNELRLGLFGVLFCVAFGASAVSFSKEKTAWSFLQLLGAVFLVLVVFTHLAAELDAHNSPTRATVVSEARPALPAA